ncbi:MAG: aldo/keto reductase [Anaerolineales bacterium]
MMLYNHIQGLDQPVSRLVQGVITASTDTQDSAFRLMDAVWELGGNAFDTAHIYGQGESERTLGKWIRERGARERAVIITKGAHPDGDGRARVTPDDITQDLMESLERLQIETIDLYLLHRDDPSVPVGPLVEVLNEHHRAGRIRVFGGSNWSHMRLREANEYATAHSLTPFGLTSPNFSLAEQVAPPWEGCQSISGEAGRAAREWYAQRHMPIFAWSSLAGGFFSGRFRRDNIDTFTDYFDKLCVTSYCVEANFVRLERAQAMAHAKNVSLPQIALAYVLNQPLNLFALVGSRTGEEFRANAEACAVTLTPAELAWLEN